MMHFDDWGFFSLPYSITNEAGASIYSVSPEACKEMPDLDPNLRSAGNYWLFSYSSINQHVLYTL